MTEDAFLLLETWS